MRGRFARMSIQVDFNMPAVIKVMIDSQLLNVEYENMMAICFQCGHIGHKTEACK